MKEIENLINKAYETIEIDSNFVEIKTNVEFKKGIFLRVFLKRVDGKICITDNRNTLRFMNTVYQLDAPDVKACINAIVNFYRFRIDKGEIFAEITPKNAKKRFNEFMICASTLANMFLFFDDPQE